MPDPTLMNLGLSWNYSVLLISRSRSAFFSFSKKSFLDSTVIVAVCACFFPPLFLKIPENKNYAFLCISALKIIQSPAYRGHHIVPSLWIPPILADLFSPYGSRLKASKAFIFHAAVLSCLKQNPLCRVPESWRAFFKSRLSPLGQWSNTFLQKKYQVTLDSVRRSWTGGSHIFLNSHNLISCQV